MDTDAEEKLLKLSGDKGQGGSRTVDPERCRLEMIVEESSDIHGAKVPREHDDAFQ